MSVTHNSSEVFLRPRFQIDVNCAEEALKKSFLDNLEKEGFLVKKNGDHIFVDIKKEESNIGSPHLQLEFIAEKDKTLIKGLFGPKPAIWTMFMFIHVALGVSFLGFSIKAYVDYVLGDFSMLAIIMLILIPIGWFVLYIVGVMGKDLGKKQMTSIQESVIRIVNTMETKQF